MTRTQALDAARVAGYHNDTESFTRLVIEERVSRIDMRCAWVQGVNAKQAGVPCTCRKCAKVDDEVLGVLSPAEMEIASCLS